MKLNTSYNFWRNVELLNFSKSKLGSKFQIKWKYVGVGYLLVRTMFPVNDNLLPNLFLISMAECIVVGESRRIHKLLIFEKSCDFLMRGKYKLTLPLTQIILRPLVVPCSSSIRYILPFMGAHHLATILFLLYRFSSVKWSKLIIGFVERFSSLSEGERKDMAEQTKLTIWFPQLRSMASNSLMFCSVQG